jgi:hypothetical protein
VGVVRGGETGVFAEAAMISKPFEEPGEGALLSNRPEKVGALPLKMDVPESESPSPVPDDRREKGTDNLEDRGKSDLPEAEAADPAMECLNPL